VVRGAFGIGLLAGRVSDAVSLGFVVETERQVEEHLASTWTPCRRRTFDRKPLARDEGR